MTCCAADRLNAVAAAKTGFRAALLAGLLLAGCAPGQEHPSAATRPAVTGGPAVAAARPAPLPAKALLGLEEIPPPITAPKNPPDAEQVPARAEPYVVEAEKLIAARDYAGAVGKLESAIRFAPNNPRIRRGLGLGYAGMQNLGKAGEHLLRAAESAPDYLQVQVALGQVSLEQKQRDRAMLALRTATKCSGFKGEDPWAAFGLLLLAGTLDEQGHWQAALECYTKLSDWIDTYGRQYVSHPRLQQLAVRPERLLSERGRLLLLLRRPREAGEALQSAFRSDRTHARTAELLTGAMIALKEFTAAETFLVQLADEPSQRGQLPALANKVCLAAGDREMPERIWLACRAKSRDRVDAELATALARTAEKLGGFKQATAILEPVMREMPGSASIGSLLSRLYARQGDFDKAFRLLASILAAEAESAPAVDEAVETLADLVKDGDVRRLAAAADAEKSSAKYAMHYIAGLLARHRGDAQAAGDQLTKVLAIKSDFLPAYELCVDLLLEQKQFDGAERVSRELRKVHEDHYLGYYLQGKVRLVRREVRPAVDALKQAMAQNPGHVPTRLLLAWACRRAGDPRLAENVLLEAFSGRPSDADLCRAMFDRYVRDARYEQAQAIVRKLLAKQPGSIPGRIMEAELHLLTGNIDTAKEKLAELRSEDPDDTGVELLGIQVQTHHAAGLSYKEQYLAAVRRLQEISRRHPKNVKAGLLLYQVLLMDDSNAEAAAALGELRRHVPEDLDVERLALSAMMLAGRHAEAVEAAAGLLREDPNDVFSRGAMLDSLVALKRFDDSVNRTIQWMQDAQTESFRLWHMWKLLDLYRKAERYERAQEVLDGWIAAGGGAAPALREMKLRLYGLAKRYDEALRYGRKLIESSPDGAALARDLLLGILYEGKAYDKMEPLLREWIGGKRDKSVERYRGILMFVLQQTGRMKEAREYAAAWTAEEPYNLAPRRAVLEALTEANQYQEALKLVDAWIAQLSGAATKPEGHAAVLAWCRRMAVASLTMQQSYREALKRADEYMRADPGDFELLQTRSNCLSELGRAKEALADIEAAHKLKPDDGLMNNNLGYMYADMGVKLDEAERMIRKAVALLPEAQSCQDSLGWVLYKRGRLRRAGGVFDDMIRQAGAEGLKHPVIC
ncbi:MAG TPA: tetratricopeptide repeat protein, partial [Phycisphaerae bacterium]|nr:tetratricopeptide repeat protein [Phycisphaerae bacterium]